MENKGVVVLEVSGKAESHDLFAWHKAACFNEPLQLSLTHADAFRYLSVVC